MHVSSHNAATGFVRVTPRTLLCSGRWCPSRQLKRVIDTPPHMRTRRRVARRPARFGSERGFSATANSGTSPDDGRLSPVPPQLPRLGLMSANRRRWSHLSCLRAMVLQTLLSRSGLKRPQWLCALAERVRRGENLPNLRTLPPQRLPTEFLLELLLHQHALRSRTRRPQGLVERMTRRLHLHL